MQLFDQIIGSLSKKDKVNLFLLCIFTIFVSVVETFAISIIMPFVGVATNFDLINRNAYYKGFYKFLGCSSPTQFVISLGIILVLFFLFKSLVGFLYFYALNYFAQSKYRDFITKMFRDFLSVEYKRYTVESLASVNKAIFSDASALSQIMTAMLQITSEVLTAVFIYSALLWVNFRMTILLTFLLIFMSFIIIKTFSKRIAYEGKRSGWIWKELSKTLNESFGNFKLIKLLSSQQLLSVRFNNSASRLIKSNVINNVSKDAPRILLESLGFFILVSIVVYTVWMYNDPGSVLSIVSIYALAFYKFLPSVSKILAYYNQILFAKSSLGNFYIDIEKHVEKLGEGSIDFCKTIELRSVYFSHARSKELLKDVNIIINNGETVAFIGESGSGKSTLLDILMGFYSVHKGGLLIDGVHLNKGNIKSWREKIGYIPQDVYLLNGTVAENVVFGRTYNVQRLIDSLVKANIYSFLQTGEGINTLVGEGGILLSGGQKQRIAIARALYSDPDILVLDEATSSLDNETEAKIMDEVYNFNKEKTLIIVAHRLSTVARCEKIYKIEKGEVFRTDFLPEMFDKQKDILVREKGAI